VAQDGVVGRRNKPTEVKSKQGSYECHIKAAFGHLRLDEIGTGEIAYNLVDRRHGRVSTAVTSNIALSDWGRYLGDATLTAAILDRLAMHAIRINISGPSWRQHVAKTRATERAPAT
jgi:hypothetical protein